MPHGDVFTIVANIIVIVADLLAIVADVLAIVAILPIVSIDGRAIFPTMIASAFPAGLPTPIVLGSPIQVIVKTRQI